MFGKCIRSLITVCFLFPLVTTNSYKSILNSNYNSSLDDELVQEVGRLVKRCFVNSNRLITLSGNISQKLTEEIYGSEFTPVTRMSSEVPLIDKAYSIAIHSRRMYFDQYYFRFDYKAQGFILAASSQPVLAQQLQALMSSRWWHATGFFFIVDDGTAITDSCINAEKYLWLTWRYDLLSSIFLCRDTSKILTMYTYNPYNTMAPKNWQKVGQRPSRSGHPWILFKRNASESPDDCGEIFYDKTKTLDDYKIRSNALSLKPRLSIDYNKTDFYRYGGTEGKMMQTIFKFLNAKLEDIPYTGKDDVGYSDENGTYVGMLSDVYSGRVDIGLNSRYMVYMWKLGTSYPYALAEMCFAVKSRGNIPQWMNLGFVFDNWISTGLVMVILLSTAGLIYRSSVSAGCLNGLRLTLCVALVRLPSQFPVRTCLANSLFLLLIANGVFQGRLVSLLTKPRAYDNPETMEDLSKGGYRVLGYKPFLAFLEDPVLHSSFEATDLHNCGARVLNEEHTTCLADCDADDIYFNKYVKFHIVRQRLQKFHLVFVTSYNWPLLPRFDQIIQRLKEAGLPDYWIDCHMWTIALHNEINSSQENRSSVLTLKDLAFIFHWLSFGLLFSTLVFFYEILTPWYKIKLRRILRRS